LKIEDDKRLYGDLNGGLQKWGTFFLSITQTDTVYTFMVPNLHEWFQFYHERQIRHYLRQCLSCSITIHGFSFLYGQYADNISFSCYQCESWGLVSTC